MEKIRILLLAANPDNTARLALDREAKKIQEELDRSPQRDAFELRPLLACTRDDLQRGLLNFQPHIVHFSGHGEQDGLYFDSQNGQAQFIDLEALSRLFGSQQAASVQCVLLNACKTEQQATAFSQHIPYTVGMSKAIGDQAAIDFAAGFYRALFSNQAAQSGKLNVELAFEGGRSAIDLAGLNEWQTPQLLRKPTPFPLKGGDSPSFHIHATKVHDEPLPPLGGVLPYLNIFENAARTPLSLTELEQINAIQRMNTNFIFLFGAADRGKTVVTSSIINFLSSVESSGDLSAFNVKITGDESVNDRGYSLYRNILRFFAERRFPARTTLVGDNEPIYVNVRFTPKNVRDNEPINLTFLEMPGSALQWIDSPEGGIGKIPASIDVFFKTTGVSISFIMVTEHLKAAYDDLLMATFIDYIRSKSPEFADARLLLLVSKWDDYDGGLSIEEFVRINMRVTHSKLHDSKHSIAEFSIGAVERAGGQYFIKTYNPLPAKKVVNWIYANTTGKPLYEKSLWTKAYSKFLRHILGY